MLQRRLQPPFHIQHHPFQIGVGLHRLDDEIMRNVVKEPGDVTIQHPRVRETPLPACLNRVQRRAARPVPIGATVELRLHHLLQLHGHDRLRHSICHSRHPEHPHATAVRLRYLDNLHRRRNVRPRGHPIPSHVQPVPQLGLEPFDRAPIHPWPTLVLLHLLERFHHRLLRDRKRLLCRLRLIHWAPPDQWPVGHLNQPRTSRPLGSTPITGASSLLRDGPPAGAATVLNPSRFLPLGGLPSPRPTRPRLCPRPPSNVPYESRRSGSRRLYAGHRLANTWAPARLHPGFWNPTRFWCHL